jgi:antitoxin ParD1/3/4
MPRKTSISPRANFKKFIEGNVYLPEEEETKILVLKKAITEGIESGISKNFNPQKHLQKLKAARKKNI